ncbi:MAG: ABC-type antimicrobial peptide transport system, ATPase component, partial [Oscillospiraceae bacterium]|nr:ABC-type antimicrobial peptide transport system, ATPase component [Oscillospiraceae bacterium]
MISCSNLYLEYPDGEKTKTILDDVNLTVNKGENVILLGPSGSGKSSLIYLLSSLRRPTKGQVFYQDISLSSQNDKNVSDIRKDHFGFIFQMHFLLPYLSVIENVMLGKSVFNKQTKEKAEELLIQLGLSQHMSKKLHQMSGGQRQRTAIARALMNEPDVIFADEPTASLDHQTASEVISILKSHKKDSILIMATHDTSILSGDERVIRIEDGKTI